MKERDFHRALSFCHRDARLHHDKRLIDILQASPKAMDALMHLDLPAGVDIELKA